MNRIRRLLRREEGSTAAEFVLFAPFILAFVLVVIAFGRIALTELSIKSATGAAAREASLSSTSEQAQIGAREMAETALANAGVSCTSLTVVIDSSGINAPLGASCLTSRCPGVIEACLTKNVRVAQAAGRVPCVRAEASSISCCWI